MEKVNDLLERYFKCETTLAEENELKQYFRSKQLSEEHRVYQSLFAAFDEELNQKIIEPIEYKVVSKNLKSFWIQTFAYSGIAATVALAIWFQRPKQSENFAMVSGTKIQDTEYAQKYAEKKFNQINDILNRSMKPVDNIEKVRKDLQPIRKISNVKEQMNELQNKLQIK